MSTLPHGMIPDSVLLVGPEESISASAYRRWRLRYMPVFVSHEFMRDANLDINTLNSIGGVGKPLAADAAYARRDDAAQAIFCTC